MSGKRTAWDWALTSGISSGIGAKKGGGGNGIPGSPEWRPDPNVAWSQDLLKGQANYLLSGLTEAGGNLSGLLGDTVNFQPEVTRLALEQMKAQLAPSYRNSQQNLTNTLEANNQLTGSTTASAFGNLEADYLAQLTSAQATAGIADIERALNTRVGLYGTGLNVGQQVGANALNNQGQQNNFNLANYENQVAEVLGNQSPKSGGFSGGITGAIGGGLQGFALSGGNPYAVGAGAIGGGIAGGFGSPGTGGQLLGAGAGGFGNRFGGLGNFTTSNTPVLASAGGESINDILRGTPYSRYGLGLN